VLLVAERRARRTERVGGDGRTGRAVAAGSHLSGQVVLDDVPVDALVVFLSYAREDDQWRRRVETMLRPMGDRGLVVWSDERIAVGEAWRTQLDAAIARADAALVLVSPDLLDSSFIMGEELPALVARGIPLALVHVRASMVDQVDALADVQWAHDRSVPIAGAADPDGEIRRACEQLVAALPAPAQQNDPGHADDSAARAPRQKLRAAAPGGALYDVPQLPDEYVHRDEVGRLRAALASSGVGTVGITGRAVGLHGQGGIGKSVLAAAVARDEPVRALFPDGIWWVTVGERADLVALQLALLERLHAVRPQLRSIDACARQLRETLVARRCLLVVDDVWSTNAARAFDVVGAQGRVLYTTRDRSILHAVHAVVQPVAVLVDEQARQLLGELSGLGEGALPPAADAVLQATGRVALAVALVGAAIRGGRSWEEAAGALNRGHHTFGTHPYADVFKAMQAATEALSPGLRNAYRTLAVYPEDTRVPVAAVTRLWHRIKVAPTPDEARDLLRELADRELVTLDEGTFGFHDLQREFLLLRAGDLRLLHADLLEAYRPEDGGWGAMALDEPYIWEHLLEHLRAASDPAGMRAVATDLGYVAARCYRDGPYAAERDVRAAAAILGREPALEWVTTLLTRSGELLGGHKSLADVAATIAFRARDAPAPLSVDALLAIAPGPLLSARWGLPQPAHELRRVLVGHTDWVRAVAFSRDGKTLASASDDRTVRLWHVPTGAERAQLEGHTGGVWAVAFSPDGETLASAGDDGTVRLWAVTAGAQRAQLDGHTDWVRAVAFSPDGETLASASDDRTVRLWHVPTGGERAELEGHTDWVRAIAFSPDGEMLASAGDDRTVRMWAVTTGIQRAQLDARTGEVQAVAFSPDGETLAGAGADGTVRVWDVRTGAKRAQLDRHTGELQAVAFSPDGETLASAGSDATVRVWDLAIRAQLDGHTDWVRAVAFSPDGDTLASAGDDRTVRVWDVARGDQQRGMAGIATPRSHAPHLDHQASAVLAVALSPDGETLASTSNDRIVRLWDVATGAQRAELDGHTDLVQAIAFSPDGQTLVSAGDDQTLRLWDVGTRAERAQLKGHTAGMRVIAFSPDGRTLASAGYDQTLRLWDIATSAERAQLKGHADWVRAIAFSPDGQTLASAGDDQTLRLWDVRTGAERAHLDGHAGEVEAVAFSPTGDALASVGIDGIVRMWARRGPRWGRRAWMIGPKHRRATSTLPARAAIAGLVFAADAGALITCATNGDLRRWDIASRTPCWRVRTGLSVHVLTSDSKGASLVLATSVGVIVADHAIVHATRAHSSNA
jgi:WD40 repeat protein